MGRSNRDGRGQPISPTASYYVQDARQVVGNCAQWWGPNGAGYVCALEDAGTYTGEQVLGMRETDVPWPASFAQSLAVSHVSVEALRRAKPGDPQGEKP